jgi:molybdopterin molybdotransferase
MSDELLPWRQAAAALGGLVAPVDGVERLTAAGASGRILAADLKALRPIPAFDHGVMDGYALGASPPGEFTLLDIKPERLSPDQAVAIEAGAAVPEGTIVVALAGRTSVEAGRLTAPTAARRDNIRRAGEEAGVGDILLPVSTLLDARHLVLAAAAGVGELRVRRRPRVALLGLTGGSAPPAQLTMLHALVDSATITASGPLIVGAGNLDATLKRLARAHDLVLVTADSVGDEEGPVARALPDPLVLRPMLKPAKPIIAGRLGAAQVLALGGTAYAVTVAAHLFLRPMLRKLAGLADADPFLPAISGFSRTRDAGRAEALPVRAVREGASLRLVPAGRFGQLSALARLDGFALVPAEAGDLVEGAALDFLPLAIPLI